MELFIMPIVGALGVALTIVGVVVGAIVALEVDGWFMRRRRRKRVEMRKEFDRMINER